MSYTCLQLGAWGVAVTMLMDKEDIQIGVRESLTENQEMSKHLRQTGLLGSKACAFVEDIILV